MPAPRFDRTELRPSGETNRGLFSFILLSEASVNSSLFNFIDASEPCLVLCLSIGVVEITLLFISGSDRRYFADLVAYF